MRDLIWIGLGDVGKKWMVPLNVAGSLNSREFVDRWSNHQFLQKKILPCCCGDVKL